MAYDTSKYVKLSSLKVAVERIKSETDTDISEAVAGVESGGISEDQVATDAEVTEMLDEIYGTSESDET